MINLRRISSDFQRYRQPEKDVSIKDPSLLQESCDQLDAAAGFFYLGFGASTDSMYAYFQGDLDIPSSQNDDGIARVTKQVCFLQCFRSHITFGFEGLGKLIQVNFVEIDLIRRREAFTTDEWQAAVEGKVTALTVHMTALAGARALS